MPLEEFFPWVVQNIISPFTDLVITLLFPLTALFIPHLQGGDVTTGKLIIKGVIISSAGGDNCGPYFFLVGRGGKGGGGVGSGMGSIIYRGVKVAEDIQHGRSTDIFLIHAIDVIIMGFIGGLS